MLKVKPKEPRTELEIMAYLTQWGPFNPSAHQVVCPNVSHGFFSDHEADLVVVNKNKYLYEIEIKVSLSDWKADFKKRKWGLMEQDINLFGEKGGYVSHTSAIKRFYYAAPRSLAVRFREIDVPSWAGVIGCQEDDGGKTPMVEILRPAKTIKSFRILTEKEILTLSRLASLRYWGRLHAELNRGDITTQDKE